MLKVSLGVWCQNKDEMGISGGVQVTQAETDGAGEVNFFLLSQ